LFIGVVRSRDSARRFVALARWTSGAALAPSWRAAGIASAGRSRNLSAPDADQAGSETGITAAQSRPRNLPSLSLARPGFALSRGRSQA
jgi:hypothetical protein